MKNLSTLLLIVVLAFSVTALAQSPHCKDASSVAANAGWQDRWNNSDLGRMVLTALPQGTACSECTSTCQARVDECKAGRMSSCYRAAQCLCQCNLDAGGCGSSREALQRCVDENKKLADEMER